MSKRESEIVAYHESGHALVASLLPNMDPVRKISIIPRGIAALGYTQQLPTEDRYLMTRSELEDRIASCSAAASPRSWSSVTSPPVRRTISKRPRTSPSAW